VEPIAGSLPKFSREKQREFLDLVKREASSSDFEVVDSEAPRLFEEVFPWTSSPVIEWDGISIPPEVPNELWITDTTFRDGQQAREPFAPEHVVDLYKLLHEIGGPKSKVLFTELFLYTSRDRRALSALKDLGCQAPKITGWIRASKEELKLVEEAGLEETGMLASISDYHIFYKFKGLSRSKVVEKYLEVIEEGLKRGIVMRAHLEDVTRADFPNVVVPFVRKLVRLSEKYGLPVRVRIPDTLGVGLPWPEAALPRSVPKIMWVLRHVCGLGSENLEFHGHNDFHMGVANATAAWLYGAALNNTTLLGIGERAGNVPLEAMVFVYASIKGTFDGMNTRALVEAAKYFEKRLGYKVPDHHPLLGKNFFLTRAGIHADGLLKDVRTYLPFDTEAILGVAPGVVVTQYSGLAGVAFWLNRRLGLSGDRKLDKNHPVVKKIHDEVMKILEETERASLTDEEMLDVAKKHLPKELLELLEGRASS